MNKLAELVLKLSRARAVLDICQEKLKHDSEYMAADKAWGEAFRAYGKALKEIPDAEIRSEVDIAIRALLETGPSD